MRHLRFVRLTLAVALAAAATAAFTAAPASAGVLGCGATTQPFARWGDSGHYFQPSNGNLENGTTGWTLSGGAAVVSGNEPYYVSGSGSHSLYLPPGSSAIGPRTCVNLFTPHARMLVAQAGTSPSELDVQVVFYGLLGNLLGFLRYDTMSANDFSTTWTASHSVSSALALPLATFYCRVKVTAVGGSGVRVDDLYEDPWITAMG